MKNLKSKRKKKEEEEEKKKVIGKKVAWSLWLSQLMKCMTLDPRIMSLSLTVGCRDYVKS